jgi:hypothetical protein
VRRYLDQAVVLALTAATVVGIEICHNRIINIVAALLLVLVLPGIAILQISRKSVWNLSRTETLVWIPIISMGVSVFGGIILNTLGGLNRFHWLVFVCAIVSIATITSLVSSTDRKVRRSPSLIGENSVRLPWIRIGSAVFVGISLLCASVLLSYTSARDNREHFAEIWLVPTGKENLQKSSAQLGIQSFEGQTTNFVVSLYQGGSTELMRRTITLRNGATWSITVHRPRNTQLRATLGHTGTRGKLQFVVLSAGA